MRNLDVLSQIVCRQHDPDIWVDDETEAEAVALCKTGGPNGGPCPGLEACLDVGTDPNRHGYTRSGVWGGLNANQRGRLRAMRARKSEDRYQTVTFTATDCRTPVQESSL